MNVCSFFKGESVFVEWGLSCHQCTEWLAQASGSNDSRLATHTNLQWSDGERGQARVRPC